MSDHDDEFEFDDDETYELDGDDFTASDMLDMIHRRAARPREAGVTRKNPTLADSAYWHGVAGQTVPVTNREIKAGAVETETEAATLARPILGRIQEEIDDD